MGIVIRQSIKATIVSYIGAAIGALLVIYIYPKALTPEQIGLTRVLTESSLLLSSFALLGMSNVAIKFFPYFKDSESNNHHGFPFIVFVIPLVGFLIYLLVFFLFKKEIVALFIGKSPLFTNYILYVIPLTFFWMYITLNETYASLLQRIVVPKFIKEVLVRILTIVIILLFFFHRVNLTQFVFLFTCIYGIATLLNIIYVNSLQKVNLKPDFGFIKGPLQKEMTTFMLYVLVVGIGSNISTKIDVFMLSQKLSLTGTGIFSIAFFIASFIEMPSRAIYQITTPFVSEALKNNDLNNVDELYKRISINQLIITGVLFFLIWINTNTIFRLMPNGHLYQSGKYVILFIGLAKVFDGATGINAIILGNSKYYYYTLFFIFFLTGLTFINNYYLIPLWGISGAALATMVSVVLYNLILVFFVKLKLGVQPFTINTVKALIVLIVSYFCTLFIPVIKNPFLDAIIRSSVLVLIIGLAVIIFHISEDLNKTLRYGLEKAGLKIRI